MPPALGAIVGAKEQQSDWSGPQEGATVTRNLGFMPLTDTAIRAAKPGQRPYKLGDSLGLFLLVQPSGGKLWRLKYRVDGREKKVGFGTYSEVSLAEARRRRDEARELVAAGKDPRVKSSREKFDRASFRKTPLRGSRPSIARSASAMGRSRGHLPPPVAANI